jgi:hypothetical protein
MLRRGYVVELIHSAGRKRGGIRCFFLGSWGWDVGILGGYLGMGDTGGNVRRLEL